VEEQKSIQLRNFDSDDYQFKTEIADSGYKLTHGEEACLLVTATLNDKLLFRINKFSHIELK
jgi:hypothetical protein